MKINNKRTVKNKEVLAKYTLWDKIIECNSIGKIDDKQGKYGKNYMKIQFNSDDNLPLNKPLKLHMLTAIVRPVFKEDAKCYPQIFLDEFLYDV